jgi:cell division protein FtsQ
MPRYRKPYRAKKKKSILKSRFFWRIILGLVFTGVSFYFFFLSPVFRIKETNISGSPAFYGEIQKLIDGRNIFLVNLEAAKKGISEKFPQIAKLNLKRKFPGSIIVQVEERKPAAVFSQGDNLFFLDKEGVIFAPIRNDISNGVGESSLIKIQKINEAGPRPDLRLGEKVLENNFIYLILDIESKLRDDFKIAVKEALIVSGERLNVKTNEGWEIYFDPQKDINWQTTKLKAVLDQEIPAEKRKNLQYIDLRFGNLASYK